MFRETAIGLGLLAWTVIAATACEQGIKVERICAGKAATECFADTRCVWEAPISEPPYCAERP